MSMFGFLRFLRKFVNVSGLGGDVFFVFVFFYNNLCDGTVLYLTFVLDVFEFSFNMYNLFFLYLLVSFHLLKIFVS